MQAAAVAAAARGKLHSRLSTTASSRERPRRSALPTQRRAKMRAARRRSAAPCRRWRRPARRRRAQTAAPAPPRRRTCPGPPWRRPADLHRPSTPLQLALLHCVLQPQCSVRRQRHRLIRRRRRRRRRRHHRRPRHPPPHRRRRRRNAAAYRGWLHLRAPPQPAVHVRRCRRKRRRRRRRARPARARQRPLCRSGRQTRRAQSSKPRCSKAAGRSGSGSELSRAHTLGTRALLGRPRGPRPLLGHRRD